MLGGSNSVATISLAKLLKRPLVNSYFQLLPHFINWNWLGFSSYIQLQVPFRIDVYLVQSNLP